VRIARHARHLDVQYKHSRSSKNPLLKKLSQILAVIALILAVGASAGVSAELSASPNPHAMVVAESAEAARAGLEIMRQGGNAIDAAAAAALVTGVTNPGACGIGGGGFMLIYMARTGTTVALDFRERAPLHASVDMFMRHGQADEQLARDGALAVAVPGEIAGIDAALKRFGTMDFQKLAEPAIRLAQSGFPASAHLADEIVRLAPELARDPGLASTFLNHDGSPISAGQTIVERALAATLRRLGNDPVKAFYEGPIAERIATVIHEHGGILDETDLATYEAVWRDAIHLPFAGDVVYTMPPPSSGGIVLEMLGMLEPGHLPGLGLNSPPYLARLAEVMRQGFIDRGYYGDPAYVHVPLDFLLSPSHINNIRARALHHAPPLHPADQAHDQGTANLCVVDPEGNVVAMTTTINTAFGAKLSVPDLGIILNNEMDDFTVAPHVPNAFGLVQASANAIAPGKRPLSSMAPSMVFHGSRPIIVLGGSGGPTIITGVLQVILNSLDFRLPPVAAVNEPRIHEQNIPDLLFVDATMPAATIKGLAAMGYRLKLIKKWFGAVNEIQIAPNRLLGAVDPHKDGGVASY
jgi:gamma-glutamyltranspeptidase/glutathione hydrolase